MRLGSTAGGTLRLWILVASISCCFSVGAQAQINSWTGTFTGGYWDEFRNWSLGVRPTNSQSIFITNAPSKTVVIDGYTSGTYPESMTVSDLTLSADAGLTNTLFLSNAGATTPLSIQDALAILSGGVLLMTNSALQVGGPAGGQFLLEGSAALAGTNSFSGGVCLGFSTNSAGFISVADGQDVFTNGYTVIGFYGAGQVVLSNGTLQAGDDIAVPNGVFLGLASGSRGTLSILGGSCVVPEHLSLGEDAGSTGLVWVTGGQLILTNGFLTTIGGNGVGQLVLSNAQILASDVAVADGLATHGTLTMAGGACTLSGSLFVGIGLGATGIVSITDSQLAVTNGSVILGNEGVGQMTLSNVALLGRSLIVGCSTGSVGTLAINGATTVVATNITVGAFSNATGVIQIAGGSLTVTNQTGTGQLTVGQLGNGFVFQNGGVVMVDQLTIASGSRSNMFSNGTRIVYLITPGIGQVVLSNGLLLAQTVKLGLATNAQATLTIAGGAISVTSNIVVGVISNANGVIQVTGGNFAVTNQSGTAQLVIGQTTRGTFTQSGGVSTVDQLIVTNGTNNVISFSSGVFNTKSTTVSNAQTFVIGDGVGVADFHLLGGIHSFANGLRVSASAVLSGCGTINGSVEVDPGGAVLADCGGALTFTGIVTNNGSLKAVNGSVLESYGPVVNNGVINVLDGNTNFHSGFVNNGVVLDSSSIPQIVSVSVLGPDVEVRFTTSSGPTYYLEFTSDLVSAGWTPLIGFIGPGGIVGVIDPGAAARLQRFYRVRLVVPQ